MCICVYIYYKVGHLFNVLTSSNEVHFILALVKMNELQVPFAAVGYSVYRTYQIYYFANITN